MPGLLDAAPRSGDELLMQRLGRLLPMRMPRARALVVVDAYETPHYCASGKRARTAAR